MIVRIYNTYRTKIWSYKKEEINILPASNHPIIFTVRENLQREDDDEEEEKDEAMTVI